MALPNSNFKNFIPELWSARLLEHLDKNLVALNFVNRDYEGDISDFGDTVHINQIGDVTIKDYTGADIDDPEELDNTQRTLVIDQAKYFNFQVKDVDEAQSNVQLLDASMERAGVNMAEYVDGDIFKYFAENAGVTIDTVEVTEDNIYKELVKLSVKLNEKNVPKSGRKIALPPYAIGYLVLDPRFTRDDSVRDNGFVGRAAGFDIYETNNLKTGTSITHAVGGTDIGMTFANQIVQTEAYRPEKNFSDAVKGLNVWGRKVVQKDATFVLKLRDGGLAEETGGTSQ